jgi:hypothetical protein
MTFESETNEPRQITTKLLAQSLEIVEKMIFFPPLAPPAFGFMLEHHFSPILTARVTAQTQRATRKKSKWFFHLRSTR